MFFQFFLSCLLLAGALDCLVLLFLCFQHIGDFSCFFLLSRIAHNFVEEKQEIYRKIKQPDSVFVFLLDQIFPFCRFFLSLIYFYFSFMSLIVLDIFSLSLQYYIFYFLSFRFVIFIQWILFVNDVIFIVYGVILISSRLEEGKGQGVHLFNRAAFR